MASRSSSVFAAVCWALTIVLIVGAVAGLGWWLQDRPQVSTQQQVTTGPTTLRSDRDYYLFVRLVEFKPRTAQDGTWDSGNNSAPDADVLIFWRGNRIFRLPTRNDALIATWDLFRVDVKQLLLSGGDIDVASSINAPIVHVAPGETVSIEVWDDDPMRSDLALRMEIPLDTLHEGVNAIRVPDDSGVARLSLELIDRQTPVSRLVEIANQN